MTDIASLIRDVPDFPKPGILFKDITPILADPAAFKSACEQMAEPFKDMGIDVVIGIESRGFIFGTLIAQAFNASFVPVRKPGKLPFTTVSEEYELEYGTDQIEIHTDAIEPGQKVLIVDDLLATGGTMEAAVKLVKKLEGDLAGVSFLIELSFIPGREKLTDAGLVHSVVTV